MQLRKKSESRSGVAPLGCIGAILVPQGGTADDDYALPVAQAMARLTGATLRILDNDRSQGRTAISILAEEAKNWESCLMVVSAPAVPTAMLQGRGPIVSVPDGRGRPSWSLRRMLVPHDGTPVVSTSLGSAGDLCRCAQAEMTMLHVATTAAAPARDVGAVRAPYYMDQPQHEWPAWGQEFLDRALAIGKPPCDVKLRTVLCMQTIAQVIVDVAAQEQSDLIVLAWRMSLGDGRICIIRQVVQQAPCPVLILPVRTGLTTQQAYDRVA
jgi:nucleotide-binding universal stress UspA family protein